jgi:predicted DsbA family dithiol-disulfide isomerase
VVWRPFELRPDPIPTLDPKGDYLVNTWRNSVYPMAREMGVKMVLPPVQPRTRLAHEAAGFAKRQGKQAEMANALFVAFFQEGRDIGEVAVLCDVGLSAGIDPVLLRACLEQRTLKDEVGEELDLAAQYEISAVPTFIVGGRYMLQGLVSEEHLKRAIALCRGEGHLE